MGIRSLACALLCLVVVLVQSSVSSRCGLHHSSRLSSFRSCTVSYRPLCSLTSSCAFSNKRTHSSAGCCGVLAPPHPQVPFSPLPDSPSSLPSLSALYGDFLQAFLFHLYVFSGPCCPGPAAPNSPISLCIIQSPGV